MTTRPPTDPTPASDPGETKTAELLARARLGTLGIIGVLAVLAAAQPSDAEAAPDPQITPIALGLGTLTVILRRVSTSQVISPAVRLALGLATYAGAIGLAALGLHLAWNLEQRGPGLAFALAAGILCFLRLAPPVRRSRPPC